MIQVKLLAFGMLKDALGADPTSISLPAGSTVADLLAAVARAYPAAVLRGIAVSVNAEYATPAVPLHDGDEVGLLPPVSGGTARAAKAPEHDNTAQHIVTYLTREPLDIAAFIARAKAAEDGAVVVFDGIVRNHSHGRRTLHLDYEAYEEMAARQMFELAVDARARFGVRHVAIVHRLGRLVVGETSVLIVVASAHRAQAYEASRWLIDTLKQQVPIWKKETFVDGSVWAAGEPFPAGLGVEGADAP